MSGWDWLHAGLEIATYAKAQRAQKDLAEMKTASEMEEARRALLEAMRSFIFDISRDIQLAEEQLTEFPQQVYIVSSSLDWRLSESGLTPDVFPDFHDKEYVLKTEKKIKEVSEKSREKLTSEKIREADQAVQYIAEIPLLQEAISAKTAQESLEATDEEWRKLSGSRGKNRLLLWLGIIGLSITVCGICPFVPITLGLIGSSEYGSMVVGLVLLALSGGFTVGSIILIIRGRETKPEFTSLKGKRENWRKQLLPQDEWQKIVSTFGNLTSDKFQKIYDERIVFLEPLLGGDFQKYLTSGA
jgi:hypothetical protein